MPDRACPCAEHDTPPPEQPYPKLEVAVLAAETVAALVGGWLAWKRWWK